jgi:crotonobetainyl-CoA:carnitine CoA-transferase CaiB-like acyl-CoA transferase
VERVLEGVKVIEVSAWAFVPSAGAVLADWGAEVIKVEPPNGDPLRGLVNAGIGGTGGVSFPWEIWNRGKRSIALDLTKPEARDIMLKLVADADVFLTSYLPPTRRKLGLDIDDVRAANPSIVYACGTGQGAVGDEAEKGGYDSISFWARGGIGATVTPAGSERPIGQPVGAFGDSLSGMALAGGVSAALLRRARTGEGAVVDGALLNTAMWCLQMSITGAAMMMATASAGSAAPSASAANPAMFNPLVNNYKTADGRWVSLCMLQRDQYWSGVCVALGRDDLLSDERFATPEALGEHNQDAIAELAQTIGAKPLAEVSVMLKSQRGQWDVMQNVLELPNDPQAIANGFVQQVSYGELELPLVAAPAQFDRTPPPLGRAPEFGADTEAVLTDLGMDMDEIIEAKISGAVV